MDTFYFYFPPLHKISGGMKVIVDLCKHLSEDNYKAFLVIQNSPENIIKWLKSYCPDLPVIQYNDCHPQKHDWWIIPEGWPVALSPGINAKSRCVVYVQNWSYLHGFLPKGLSWKNLQAHFWAVSFPVRKFIIDTIGYDAPVIPPAINRKIFYPEPKDPTKNSIAWMPRKNRGLAEQTRFILEALLSKNNAPFPEWVEINNKSTEEVAQILKYCNIFFASGFPEGCPLPPLEAMACGCLNCGFAGFGGWDYMRQGMPHGHRPNFDLPIREWGPNGFFAADAATFEAAKALEYAIQMTGTPEAQTILTNAAATASFYSPENQKNCLLRAIAATRSK